MIHMYITFNYDTFCRFLVMTKNVNFLLIYEHRGANLRSPYDVMDEVITTKNTFSCIIWDDLFISDIKLKLHVIFWYFQYGRHFDVTANFFYWKRYWKLTITEQCPIINAPFHFWEGGGGIDIGIGDVTLVRMFKSLIWMTHYFSSNLNVLGISKYILLLLDILATIQFLFHHFCPSIKRATIFINYFDLLIMKYAVRFRSLWYFTQLMAMYFYILCENFKQIHSVVFEWNAFKISTLYGL